MVFGVGEEKQEEDTNGGVAENIVECDSCVGCRAKQSPDTAPKLLPCLHSLCKACFTHNSGDGKPQECPLCSQSYNLSEVADCYIFEDPVPKCGGCEETEVSGWCEQCEEALCSDCISAHRRVKVTRNHTVRSLECSRGMTASLRCSSHKQERLKFFCLTCNELTCRDCQLINHRGHSFLLLEEAVVSQKERLQKLVHSIKEQRDSVKDSLLDLDGRLHNIQNYKAASRKKIANFVHSMYMMMVGRGRQLYKEVEGLYDEEEKSLMETKTTLKNLVDRQKYIAAFIQKILRTEGRGILLHKKLIEKHVNGLLSQKTRLSETTILPLLQIQQDFCNMIKSFGSIKVDRIPVKSKKYKPSDEHKDAPKEADNRSSGLNPKASATLSVPDAASSQPIAHTQSIVAPRLPQCGTLELSSSKEAQPTPVSSAPLYSNTSQQPQVSQASAFLASAQPMNTQTSQVFRSLSYPPISTSYTQSASSVPSQPVSNYLPSSLSYPSMMVLQRPPLPGGLPTAAPQPRPAYNTVAHQPILFHTNASQPSQPSNINSAQSQFHTFNHPISQAVGSTLGSSALSSQAMSASTNRPPPIPPDSSTSQLVYLQHTSSAASMSSPLLFTLLRVPSNNTSLSSGSTWKFLPCPRVSTVNQSDVVPCAPQPAVLITTPASVPREAVGASLSDCTSASTLKDNSSLPLKLLPMRNEVLPATQKPCTSNNPDQSEQATQPTLKPQCELPVKAPADSVCEGDSAGFSRASPAIVDQDSSLPTSTVPEMDTTEPQTVPKHCPPSSPTTIPVPSLTVQGCTPNHSSPPLSQSPLKSTSTSKHWSTGLPTSFYEILQQTDAPASKGDDVCIEDTVSRSETEVASLPSMKNDDEKTDISDSELVEEEVTESEEPYKLLEDGNRSLHVILHRLPIALPASGSPLPQFRITPTDQTEEILLEEIQEGKLPQRLLRIPALPNTVSPPQSCSPDSHLQADVLDCVVCLSAGASLLCAECGRSFHTDCHVPPIFRLTEVWVCSLCQDVFDDTDPFRYDRVKEPYLSLQDQRRCEQLLLTLMCEEHSYLLYRAAKHSEGSVDFDFIVGRLLGKRSPPYRSAAELVSDMWVVFGILLAKSKKKDMVVKLQSSFQERLDTSFGKNLHPSLLRPNYSEDLQGAPETTLDKERAKTTLKRMREFLAAKCDLVAKKPNTEKRDEDSRGGVTED